MEWHTIDYYGITTLDPRVVDLLNQFLQDRESRLAVNILHILPFPVDLPTELKLADAVEGFSKQIHGITKMEKNWIPVKNFDEVVSEMNVLLWEYTEIIEGCAVELFQQVKQVSVYHWDKELLEVVQAVKRNLIHHIDELTWMIRRIDQQLVEYREKIQLPKKRKWSSWIKKPSHHELDTELHHHLAQTHQLLQLEFNEFFEQYQRFIELSREVDASMSKYKNFVVLPLLEDIEQSYYYDAVKLLKFWKLDPSTEDNLGFARTLRNIFSVQFILRTYKNYYDSLKTALFRCSIELKEAGLSEERLSESVKETLKERAERFQEELKEFIINMCEHREFLLKTDPNPYVRSHWGFTEHPVGPEPHKTKEILALIFKAEELNRWYSQFIASIADDKTEIDLVPLMYDIDKLIHEMSQPLTSQSMMRRSAGRVLNKLSECNELGSSSMGLVLLVDEILNKAMRLDWKYHVLHEMPLFHEVFRIHKGLRKEAEDLNHRARLEKFKKLCHRIQEWLNKGDLMSHAHEMELDMNDIKIYLQEFFANVQRAIKDKPAETEIGEQLLGLRHQLLDYRYLFGDFFLNLMNKETEGSLLRNQFLFVDQYFESIEGLWKEINESRKNIKDAS